MLYCLSYAWWFSSPPWFLPSNLVSCSLPLRSIWQYFPPPLLTPGRFSNVLIHHCPSSIVDSTQTLCHRWGQSFASVLSLVWNNFVHLRELSLSDPQLSPHLCIFLINFLLMWHQNLTWTTCQKTCNMPLQRGHRRRIGRQVSFI